MSPRVPTESLARYQFVEALIAEKTVLEIGCGIGRGADFLARYARMVTAVESSVEKLAEARRRFRRPNLVFEQRDAHRLQLDRHSFDVVLMPDIDRWLGDPAVITEVRRVLKPDGFACLASPRATAYASRPLSLDELRRYVGQAFPAVRLFGQIPFWGQTFADFEPSPAPIEPALDCSLIDQDEPPNCYVIVCGETAPEALGYTVVQVPPGDDQGLGAVAASGQLGELRRQLELAEQELHQHRAERQTLQRALAQAREAKRVGGDAPHSEDRSAVDEPVDPTTAGAEQSSIQQALEAVRDLAGQQSRRAETAEQRCDTLVARIEEGAAELSKLHQRVAELQSQRHTDSWRIDEITARLRETEARAKEQAARAEEAADLPELRQQLRRSEARLAEAERNATAHESRAAQLEVKLKRSATEAATLSRWAEQLRSELKQARGESSLKPPTPEPELYQLRQQAKQAEQRVEELEARCRQLTQETKQKTARLVECQSQIETLQRRKRRTDNAQPDGAIPDAAASESQSLLLLRQRQIEVLLKGAALHKREAEGWQRRFGEMDERLSALREERAQATRQLHECEARCRRARQDAEQYRLQLSDASRQLARAQGELKRYRRTDGASTSAASLRSPTF